MKNKRILSLLLCLQLLASAFLLPVFAADVEDPAETAEQTDVPDGEAAETAETAESGETTQTGDATLTRAAVRLTDGTLGYSWVQGRDKQHAERCALIDALMQQSRHFQNLSETLIAPLDADRMARIAARQAEVNASRVDFFTMVRGDNA